MRLSLQPRSVRICGRRTSVRLEEVMWEALRDIAAREDRTVHQLVDQIARERKFLNLTATIRAWVVEYYRQMARQERDGHEKWRRFFMGIT